MCIARWRDEFSEFEPTLLWPGGLDLYFSIFCPQLFTVKETTMTTAEIAKQLVELCSKGENAKVHELYYSPNIVSIEAMDMPNAPREARGIAAVNKKSEWWTSNHTVHAANVKGPFVAVDKFAVVFDYDVTFKPTGKRNKMTEVAVYTVAGGKIVHEEFLYAM